MQENGAKIKAEGVTLSFGGVNALIDVSFALKEEEGRIYELGESPKANRVSNRSLTQASRRWSR